VLDEKGCIEPNYYSAESDEVKPEIPSVITARRLLQPLDDVFEYPKQYRSEHHNTTSTKEESVSSWWKWIVLALVVLLSVLVVMMLVSVLYWLRQDRSGANDVATVLVEGDENQYDLTTSSSPSSSPTTVPSITAGSSKTHFLPLANHPNSTFLAMVSSCDDCEEYVELPFKFLWLGKLPVTSISVSSNGAILVGSKTNLFGPCCGTINVVAADLDPSLQGGGGIWTLSIPGAASANGVLSSAAQAQQERQSTLVAAAFRVSWENVHFWSDASQNATTFVNAQATLYPSGNIDLCWSVGQTDGNSFLAGIVADTAITSTRKFPARSEPFNDMGQTKGGTWPLHQCRSFVFSELDDDIATTTTTDNDETRVRSLAPSPMPTTRMVAPEDESPPGTTSCTSTIRDGCITNATHLRYALLQAQPGETIALCGGESLHPITTEDGPLVVQEFNIILCCADMTTCSMRTSRVKRRRS
jgi:hypothetical protein